MIGFDDKWRNFDLTLKNGRRVFRPLNPRFISDVTEIPYNKYRLSWRFPFIKKEQKTYVGFYQWDGPNDWNEKRYYKLDCNLNGFLQLFGIESVWSATMMRTDLRYGNHN